MAKNFTRILCAFLAFVMCLGTVPFAYANGIELASIGANSINKVASDLVDDFVDVTLSVPGEDIDLSSDIVFITGAGPANNYNYIVEMIHKMLVAVDGTPTKIKIGMVSFANTTEEETVLNLTEMIDTVPGNKVADYRFSGSSAEYEAKLADWIAETPELENDMEFIIAKALERAETVYDGVNLESSLITARDMLAADTTVPADRKHMIVISTGLAYWFDNDAGEPSTIAGTHADNGKYMTGNKYWLYARNKHGNTSNGYVIPTAFHVKDKNENVVYTASWNNYWSYIESWIAADQNNYVFTPYEKNYGDFAISNVTGKESKPWGYAISTAKNIEIAKSVVVPKFTEGANPLTTPAAAHALNYERGQYEALMVYRQMETPIGESVTTLLKDKNGNNITLDGLGFNCYAIAIGKTPEPGSETTWLESNQIGYNFMCMMGGENTVNYNEADLSFFDSIENKILFTCAAGSYVEDYIGYNRPDQGNFEFVTDPATISMVRGGVTYKAEQIDTKEGATASYKLVADGEKDFLLDYYRGNGKDTERFIWTFGDYASLEKITALTYKLKLIDKSKEAGTYTVDTNLSATLYPKDSDGKDGTPVPFPVPNVTYEVKPYDVDIVLALGAGIAKYDIDYAGGSNTYDSIVSLVEPLVNQGINVKLGLVAVEHYDDVAMPLTVLTKDNYTTVITDGLNAIQQMPAGPTNLHGNIVAAKEMLDEDTSVPAENKFFYVIATGRTYNYDNADGVPTTIVNKIALKGNTYYYWGHYLWQSQRGGHTSLYMIPDRYNNDFAAYWADVEKWVEADGDKYAYSFTEAYNTNNPQWFNTFFNANNKDAKALGLASSRFGWIMNPLTNSGHAGIGSGSNPQNALSYERAQYEAYQTYQEMKLAGYNCYALCSESTSYQNDSPYIQVQKYTGTSTIQLGHSFMNFLAGGEATLLFKLTDPNTGASEMAKNFFTPIDQSRLVETKKAPQTLSFSEHTVDVTASTGDIASFIVEAEGDGLTYAWYYKTSKMSDYALSSFVGNEYNAVMSGKYDEQQIYCVVTDQYGNTQTTETVALTLE